MTLFKFITVSLVITQIATIIVAVIGVSIWSAAPNADINWANAYDSLQMVVPIASLIFYAWFWGITLRRTYQLATFAKLHSSAPPPIGPVWSVLYYFIPIALLWKPYEGLKQNIQCVQMDSPILRQMPRWWGMFLASVILITVNEELYSRGSGNYTFNNVDFEMLKSAEYVTAIGAIATIAWAILAFHLFEAVKALSDAHRFSETFD